MGDYTGEGLDHLEKAAKSHQEMFDNQDLHSADPQGKSRRGCAWQPEYRREARVSPWDKRPSELDRDEFVALFGGVYEHSPWIAERVWDAGDVPDDPAVLAEAMAEVVEQTGAEAQLALLRAHPDLAGRLAVVGELTPESSAEQTSAGLDRCTPEEFAEFQHLNRKYTGRFGFPFIIAVRGRDRSAILAAFRRRLHNDADVEFREALNQVHQIARLRLAAMADD